MFDKEVTQTFDSSPSSQTSAQSREKLLNEVHQACAPSALSSTIEYAYDIGGRAAALGLAGFVLADVPGLVVGGIAGAVTGAADAHSILQNKAKACEFDKLHDVILHDGQK
jgi:hypothetical protein